jgi:hypothetical protein
MGAVYAAEDQELHTLVAIKTLHPHMATSPKVRGALPAKKFTWRVK